MKALKGASRIFILLVLFVVFAVFVGSHIYAANSPKAKTQQALELGSQYLEDLDYDKAILSFTDAIEISPSDSLQSESYRNRGLAYLEQGDTAAAAADLEQAARLQGTDGLEAYGIDVSGNSGSGDLKADLYSAAQSMAEASENATDISGWAGSLSRVADLINTSISQINRFIEMFKNY